MIARTKTTWAYAAVIVLGVGLAVPGLGKVSYTQNDEVTYFLTASSLSLLLDWGWDNRTTLAEGTADVEGLRQRYENEGLKFVLPYYSKPLFDLIYWLAMVFFGVSQRAILFANLLLFALAIWWMARVGESLFGTTVGFFAALFLATSGSALVYTRTGMSHMASLALFLLGAYQYLRLSRDMGPGQALRLCVPGAIWAMSLAVHPNLVPFVGLCGCAELLRSWRLLGYGAALRRALCLSAGALMVGLCIEAVYRLIGLIFSDTFAGAAAWQQVPFRTYAEQLALHAGAVIDGEVSLLHKVYTYLLLFWAHEGFVVAALIGLLTVHCFRRLDDYKTLFVIALFWIPLIFFLISRNQAVFRYAAGIVLPASLLAAIALERILLIYSMRWSWSQGRALRWAVFAIVVVNFAHIRPIYGVESAWMSTAEWLRVQDENQIIAASGGSLWTINGIENVSQLNGIEGVRYLAMNKRYEKEWELAVLQQCCHGAQPVFTAPHWRPDKLLEIEFLEQNLLLDGLEMLPRIGDFIAEQRDEAIKMNRLHFLEIYDLLGMNRASDEVSKRDGSIGPVEEIKRLG
jgi:hypothetical protein